MLWGGALITMTSDFHLKREEGEVECSRCENSSAVDGRGPLVAVVFMTPEATREELAAVREHLEADPTIAIVEFLDMAQSFERMKKLFARQPELMIRRFANSLQMHTRRFEALAREDPRFGRRTPGGVLVKNRRVAEPRTSVSIWLGEPRRSPHAQRGTCLSVYWVWMGR